MEAIPGLAVVDGFVSVNEERALITAIGLTPRVRGRGAERNRIERYGPGVLASGYSNGDLREEEIPPHLATLCARVADVAAIPRPNAVSVNEYLVGQGLELHVDREWAGLVIATLALLSDARLAFQNGDGPILEVPHRRGALLLMRAPCRDAPWRHGVPPVIEDRISIVFRRAAI